MFNKSIDSLTEMKYNNARLKIEVIEMKTMMTSKQIGAISNFNHFNLVEKWISFSQVSAASEKSYRKGIKRFAEYVAENSISTLNRENLIAYREMLAKKYSPSTTNLYISAIKLFLRFLQLEGVLTVNPAEHLKGLKIEKSHKKDALSINDTKKILNSIDTSTLKGKRDLALYSLMTTSGLRTVEICRADIGDIVQHGNKYFLYVCGKGRSEKSESVQISAGVYEMIQNYLRERGELKNSAPLFASVSHRNFGGRLLTTSISRIIKSIFRRAGYNSRRITAHSLRHTCATTALLAGATLRQVQQVLRHKSITVTEIYISELNRFANDTESLVAKTFGI